MYREHTRIMTSYQTRVPIREPPQFSAGLYEGGTGRPHLHLLDFPNLNNQEILDGGVLAYTWEVPKTTENLSGGHL